MRLVCMTDAVLQLTAQLNDSSLNAGVCVTETEAAASTKREWQNFQGRRHTNASETE